MKAISRIPALLLATFACFDAVAAEPAPAGLVLVQTQSRLEVDAEGRVVSVTTTPELPTDVAAAVDANLKKMRFAPPTKDGRPVAGVTWARQDACAAPEAGSYRFVVKFRGNGPSLQKAGFPLYPRVAERGGVQARWDVVFDIAADGSATLVEARRNDKDQSKRFDREFRASLAQWVKSMRYQPETLDGQPVATRMSEEVEFILGRPGGGMAKLQQARIVANDACVSAIADRDDDKHAVALDSPFSPLPAN